MTQIFCKVNSKKTSWSITKPHKGKYAVDINGRFSLRSANQSLSDLIQSSWINLHKRKDSIRDDYLIQSNDQNEHQILEQLEEFFSSTYVNDATSNLFYIL